ncbi:hypothetical protein FBEOM_4393 [Fusarium beomiforme]|uniref:Secreted protein n=1 Tax=Fusarium beomiforme TaxID=44412 RepID=A0A9P5AMT6_9HYPO|nr:hypothetical protein FBEOM_4393 [Fusarium beomiforme]
MHISTVVCFLSAAPGIVLGLAIDGHMYQSMPMITRLPENADVESLRYQPLLDFDEDSCYNTAAIDQWGNVNFGMPVEQMFIPYMSDYNRDDAEIRMRQDESKNGISQGSAFSFGCRNFARLEHANAYSRYRCNNGWCAYMYEYYFEVDRSAKGSRRGHVHDWENVVVFVKNGTEITRVAPSAHGRYKKATNQPVLDRTHPLIVYHKDGWGTHCMRIAKEKERFKLENVYRLWQRAPLVGWNGYPSKHVRDRLSTADFGKATFKLIDSRFGDALKKAAGKHVPGFDPYKDE